MLNTKISAKLEKEHIVINAKFFREQEATEETPAGEVLVHEINTAFLIGTQEKKIREEIKRAGDLFELEERQRAGQAEVDEKFEKANEVINNLNQ
jgi:hypothetical protein